jgi:4-hydroxy-tetrahydrodipicolinate reductase
MRLAVHGTGRMASAIARAAATRDDDHLLALAGPKAPAWETSAPWVDSLDALPDGVELLIDFTLPGGTISAARWCAAQQLPMVSGVTGLTDEVRDALAETARVAPVLWSPNLSLGVNLLADLAARAAAVLDSSTPVVIEDIHHQWKKDAPSGTALMLGERIAAQRGGADADIAYESIREGEVIGEHTITFEMAGESFDLVHRARDRSIYALGALEAGRWLLRQPPGLYSAADWLAGRG